MHLFAYLKHLIAARSLFSRKAFSSGREEKRYRAKGDYFSEIITFIAELQNNLCQIPNLIDHLCKSHLTHHKLKDLPM